MTTRSLRCRRNLNLQQQSATLTIHERFSGAEGTRNVVRALEMQQLIANDASIAEAVASQATVHNYNPGDLVLTERGTDNDICFILAGLLAVEISGREVARRGPGQHVGEMAMLDVSASRSASVRAIEDSVVARVPEPAFGALAANHPLLWKRLAAELANRLRERGSLVRVKNEQPVVFIGSTAEQLEVARGLQAAFAHDPWLKRVWTDGVFGAGRTPLESLVAQLKQLDFALLVVTPDDLVESRGESGASPRDNVIFELGLMIGELGRNRTFMVRERGVDLKVPSDLLGVQPLEIEPGSIDSLTSRIAPAATAFRIIVNTLNCR